MASLAGPARSDASGDARGEALSSEQSHRAFVAVGCEVERGLLVVFTEDGERAAWTSSNSSLHLDDGHRDVLPTLTPRWPSRLAEPPAGVADALAASTRRLVPK
jgi:hypothetical protein